MMEPSHKYKMQFVVFSNSQMPLTLIKLAIVEAKQWIAMEMFHLFLGHRNIEIILIEKFDGLSRW